MGLSRAASSNTEFTQLFYALLRLAPYGGTGHKTTFGLGQTRSGWLAEQKSATSEHLLNNVLAERIEELTNIFTAQRKRKGGNRTDRIAVTWATILARREHGETLAAIAQDIALRFIPFNNHSRGKHKFSTIIGKCLFVEGKHHTDSIIR